MDNQASIKAVFTPKAAKLLKAYHGAVCEKTQQLHDCSKRKLDKIELSGTVYTNPQFLLGVRAGMSAAAVMLDTVNAALVQEGEDDE